MAVKHGTKRKAGPGSKDAVKKKAKVKDRKGKGRSFIDIPSSRADQEDDGDGDGDDGMTDGEDLDVDAAQAFIQGLDRRGITRARHELTKENRLAKPAPLRRQWSTKVDVAHEEGGGDGEMLSDLDDDDLALGSGSDDLDELSDDLDELSDDIGPGDDAGSTSEDELDDSDLDESASDDDVDDSDLERDYASRRRPAQNDGNPTRPKESRLPIRLATGEVQRFMASDASAPSRVRMPSRSPSPTPSAPSADEDLARNEPAPRTNPYGARFGRPSLMTLLALPSKPQRVAALRSEIAAMARTVVEDPEMGASCIKRLSGLSQGKLKGEGGGKGAKVDPEVRVLAIGSLLAVFLDIIPGYRIRPLSEAEKDVQASQQVARQRDFESSLVASYKSFLALLESCIASSPTVPEPTATATKAQGQQLGPMAFKALCVLVREKAHFNYSVNIIDVLVRKLGMRRWDSSSDECLRTLAEVLVKEGKNGKGDGAMAKEVVRAIGRTVKARGFDVDPRLVGLLANLRLTSSAGRQAKADGAQLQRRGGKLPWKDRGSKKAGKAEVRRQVESIKAKKARKETEAIEREIAEAEEEVKEEDRERNETDVVKAVFAIYFRILKDAASTPSLDDDPAAHAVEAEVEAEGGKGEKGKRRDGVVVEALKGLGRFGHLVNVDFFKDVMRLLDRLVNPPSSARVRLAGVVAAHELLSGQGEAISIDLGGFVDSLYSLIPRLPFLPSSSSSSSSDGDEAAVIIESTFQALEKVFFASRTPAPTTRCLGFAKRLLGLAVSATEPATSRRALAFVRRLASREPRVKGLFLGDEDDDDDQQRAPVGGGMRKGERGRGGVGTGGVRWRPEAEQVERSGAEGAAGWEIGLLGTMWDAKVRDELGKLLEAVRA